MHPTVLYGRTILRDLRAYSKTPKVRYGFYGTVLRPYLRINYYHTSSNTSIMINLYSIQNHLQYPKIMIWDQNEANMELIKCKPCSLTTYGLRNDIRIMASAQRKVIQNQTQCTHPYMLSKETAVYPGLQIPDPPVWVPMQDHIN